MFTFTQGSIFQTGELCKGKITRPDNLTTIATKKQQFRMRIRREDIDQKFSVIRKSLLEELRSSELVERLKSIRESNVDAKKLLDLISLCEENQNCASFNYKMCNEQIEICILETLLKEREQLMIEEKVRLFQCLIYLTYFCQESSKKLASGSLVLLCIKEMKLLSTQKLDAVVYLKKIVELMMNLSSIFDEDFNSHLMESDFPFHLNSHIAKTSLQQLQGKPTAYCQEVYDLRQQTLRFYTNVLSKLRNMLEPCKAVLSSILKDNLYCEKHQERVILLLSRAIKIPHLWEELVSKNDILYIITYMFGKIQQRYDFELVRDSQMDQISDEEMRKFNAVVHFLNKLDEEDSDYCDWFTLVTQTLNSVMLSDFLLAAVKQDKIKYIRNALCLLRDLAFRDQISNSQLLISRIIYPENQMLRTICSEKLLLDGKTSQECLQTLRAILKKDESMIEKIMEFRTLDRIELILSDRLTPNSVLRAAIFLCEQFLESEKKYHPEDAINRVMRAMMSKNIHLAIEQLQDHEERDISKISERFMSLIERYSSVE